MSVIIEIEKWNTIVTSKSFLRLPDPYMSYLWTMDMIYAWKHDPDLYYYHESLNIFNYDLLLIKIVT